MLLRNRNANVPKSFLGWKSDYNKTLTLETPFTHILIHSYLDLVHLEHHTDEFLYFPKSFSSVFLFLSLFVVWYRLSDWWNDQSETGCNEIKRGIKVTSVDQMPLVPFWREDQRCKSSLLPSVCKESNCMHSETSEAWTSRLEPRQAFFKSWNELGWATEERNSC